MSKVKHKQNNKLKLKLNQVQPFRDQNERKPIRLLLFSARACDRTGSRDQIR